MGRTAQESRLAFQSHSKGSGIAELEGPQPRRRRLGLRTTRASVQSTADVPRRSRAMKLTPREIDHLLLHQCGFLAQKRLARGLKLNHAEATALIATVVLELIRDGKTCSELMDLGRKLLGKNQVASRSACVLVLWGAGASCCTCGYWGSQSCTMQGGY